ncbi:MurR/RpiR family transcriptional regulator [Labrenzia sp. OB1]|uniref:MurR/RpiR family transcriptional regulator n=1 Tax=Labrenzia sp. OB1 TaxID=1561204 RepID=UPI0007B26C2A|nr:MurR/RpiR family transcriptional regulator [Labrenzia sp. OB1]KZM50108.1 RpiR family transcriptional regulator [Labrenzia sp. OB1]
MDILARIQNEQGQFSQSEKRIADILLNDFDFAVNASIVELAERAEVSPPTVTRFCRRLNCQNYADFKVQLAKTMFVGARYLNPGTKSTEPADVAEDIITKAQNALFLFHRAFDAAAAQSVADILSKSAMIYAFGSGGNSSMIAHEFQNRLFRLGLRISSSTDHHMQMMQAAAARPEDSVIGSSFSGRNMELVRAFTMAREAGATTIALTQADSPVAKAADHVLAIDLPEGNNIFRPTSTRFVYLALVDILANLAAYQNRAQSTVTLRHIKHQLVAYRDEDDKQLLGD